MQKMSPVVHFEMPYGDSKRMSTFYENAFGWQTQALGEEMGNYVLATTSEGNEQGHPKEPGRINGGFHPKSGDAQHPSLVLGVESLQESMDAIRKAGGQVLGEPMEIPGYGMYVSFLDTEGNRLSLMEPFMGNPEPPKA